MLQKLKASHRKQVGTTESPTTDMYGDCQELLQLFGLPYIIAPAEAEAQCAWLDAQGLVDGVVTDDNDAFLFGAKHIYRYILRSCSSMGSEEYHLVYTMYLVSDPEACSCTIAGSVPQAHL